MAWSKSSLNVKGPAGATGATGAAGTTSWNGLTDKPAVIAAGTTQSEARSAIGAAASADRGVANGIATLDSAGKVPYSQLPASIMSYQGTYNASTNVPALSDGVGDVGDTYRVSVAGTRNFGSGNVVLRVGDYVIYSGSVWQKSATTDNVASVAGKNGDVMLTAADVGLGNVDNTADANKAVLSASKLTTARTVQTNLAATAAATFDGSANITPGVTGTLPVANGGTGVTSLTGWLPVTGISATGTPSASTYLRGDGSWQTVAGESLSPFLLMGA